MTVPAARRPVRTTGPKVLTFVGVAVVVVAVVLGAAGAFFVAAGAVDHKSREDLQRQVDDTAVVSLAPGQTQSVELTAAMRYMVWPEPGTTRSAATTPVVTDLDGDKLSVEAYDSLDWASGLSAWSFRPTQTGTHEVTAPDVAVVLAPEIPAAPPDVGAYASLVGVLTLVLATALGFVGLAMTIGGAVWWSTRAKHGP